jgi:hypothetical protein
LRAIELRLRRLPGARRRPWTGTNSSAATEAYPPDGELKLWWDRLKKALGTVSSDFVNAAIFQLPPVDLVAAEAPSPGLA